MHMCMHVDTHIQESKMHSRTIYLISYSFSFPECLETNYSSNSSLPSHSGSVLGRAFQACMRLYDALVCDTRILGKLGGPLQFYVTCSPAPPILSGLHTFIHCIYVHLFQLWELCRPKIATTTICSWGISKYIVPLISILPWTPALLSEVLNSSQFILQDSNWIKIRTTVLLPSHGFYPHCLFWKSPRV